MTTFVVTAQTHFAPGSETRCRMLAAEPLRDMKNPCVQWRQDVQASCDGGDIGETGGEVKFRDSTAGQRVQVNGRFSIGEK